MTWPRHPLSCSAHLGAAFMIVQIDHGNCLCGGVFVSYPSVRVRTWVRRGWPVRWSGCMPAWMSCSPPTWSRCPMSSCGPGCWGCWRWTTGSRRPSPASWPRSTGVTCPPSTRARPRRCGFAATAGPPPAPPPVWCSGPGCWAICRPWRRRPRPVTSPPST